MTKSLPTECLPCNRLLLCIATVLVPPHVEYPTIILSFYFVLQRLSRPSQVHLLSAARQQWHVSIVFFR